MIESAVIGGLIGASFVLIYLASILDKQKYGVLQVLLMFIALGFLTVSVSVSAALLRIESSCTTCAGSGTKYTALADNLDVLYSVMVYALSFILFVFLLTVIISVFRNIWGKINNKKGFGG